MALEKHGTVMDPVDKAAALDAITEMRALLGSITLAIRPAAMVTVDGESLRDEAIGKPIFLGPGEHKIEARAEGYVAAERTVTLVSGQQLALTLGFHKASAALPAGPPTSSVEEPKPSIPLRDQAPQRRGPYVLAVGSVLVPLTHSSYLEQPDDTFGPGYGIRIGFQVNRFAGFEVAYQHSNLFTDSTTSADVSYSVISDRLAGALRLLSWGEVFRVVGAIGGGVVIDSLSFNADPSAANKGCHSPAGSTWCPLVGSAGNGNPGGVDAFALMEAGVELDIDHVLVDVVGESQFEATGNFTSTPPAKKGVTSPVGIYGASPIINVGPSLRIGYRFW